MYFSLIKKQSLMREGGGNQKEISKINQIKLENTKAKLQLKN